MGDKRQAGWGKTVAKVDSVLAREKAVLIGRR